MTLKTTRDYLLLAPTLILVAGCQSDDRYQEAARIAEQAAEQQAAQNVEMARLNREIAAGASNLVTAEAEARKEMVVVQREVQSERAKLNDGFGDLEAERKQIAAQRRTESMILPSVELLGFVAVAIVVIGFCWTLLFGLRGSTATDSELAELMIHDLTQNRPRLLHRAVPVPAIEDQQSSLPPPTRPALEHVSKQNNNTDQQGDDF